MKLLSAMMSIGGLYLFFIGLIPLRDLLLILILVSLWKVVNDE